MLHNYWRRLGFFDVCVCLSVEHEAWNLKVVGSSLMLGVGFFSLFFLAEEQIKSYPANMSVNSHPSDRAAVTEPHSD